MRIKVQTGTPWITAPRLSSSVSEDTRNLQMAHIAPCQIADRSHPRVQCAREAGACSCCCGRAAASLASVPAEPARSQTDELIAPEQLQEEVVKLPIPHVSMGQEPKNPIISTRILAAARVVLGGWPRAAGAVLGGVMGVGVKQSVAGETCRSSRGDWLWWQSIDKSCLAQAPGGLNRGKQLGKIALGASPRTLAIFSYF